MALDTLPPPVDTEEIELSLPPEVRVTNAVNTAGTIAEALGNLQAEAARARGDGDEEAVALLEKRAAAVSAVSGKYGSVQVAYLGSGVMGMAPVGGSVGEIYISASLLAHGSSDKMLEVLVHEERHTNQVQLKTGGKGAVLIAGDTVVEDETVLYEGDTETHQTEMTGERNDRPQAVYQEGFDLFKDLSGHRSRLNEVMTGTGDVGSLQNDIWKDGLEDGSLNIQEIQEQSKETGYELREQIVTWQNREWVQLVEDKEMTEKEVIDAARRSGLELQDEAKKAIAAIAAETRDQYENGPESARTYSLN